MSNKDRTGTGLQKALKPLRNSLINCPARLPMWVVCTKERMLMPFFLSKLEAEIYCDEVAGINITACVKRVNITITFPSTSSGDTS